MPRQYLRQLWRTLFPQSCCCCRGRLLSNEQYVCTTCMMDFPRTFLGSDARDNEFVRRYWGVNSAESGTAVFAYFPGSELASVIHAMKYGHKPDLCRFMGRAMTSSPLVMQIMATADALVPVPITEARHAERGYNQSEELCRGISDVAAVPVRTDALRRIHFSESQTALAHAERIANVEGAFALADCSGLEGKHIVLVDDIVTTGSTTLECQRILSTIPGVKVSIVALALTMGYFR